MIKHIINVESKKKKKGLKEDNHFYSFSYFLILRHVYYLMSHNNWKEIKAKKERGERRRKERENGREGMKVEEERKG